MKTISQKLAHIVMSMACVVGANQAHALIVTTGCANTNSSCTLQELASGASIAVDGQRFDNWLLNSASALPINLSGITVAGLDDQTNNPGLRYVAGGNLSTLGLDLIDLDLSFRVTTISGPMVTGASLQIDQFLFSAGNVGGFVGVSEDILEANGVNLIGEQSVFAGNLAGSMALFDSITFASSSPIVVATNIIVSGDDSANAVSLDRFTQRFAIALVPEPSTTLLLMAGLIGLLLPKRRRLIDVALR